MGEAMNDIQPILEQARAFIAQYVSPELMTRTAPLAIVLVVAGVGFSVLGAKVARPALTTMLGLVGAFAGARFARELGCAVTSGWPVPPSVIGAVVGAVMLGTIAHLTFRIWVGAGTAAVLTALALGGFGVQRVVPHVADFDAAVTVSPLAGGEAFSIPSPGQQQTYRDRSPREWARQLWSFVTEKDASLERNSRLLGLGTAAAGLFLGVVLVRWMLILSTSLVGAALVTTGLATLFTHFVPGSYQAFVDHPAMVGMGVGGLIVTSLIVQTLVTRKPPTSRGTPKSGSPSKK